MGSTASNVKAPTTTTTTTTNTTTILQSKNTGTDAAALAQALAGVLGTQAIAAESPAAAAPNNGTAGVPTWVVPVAIGAGLILLLKK